MSKTDAFSKILLATQTINYLASCINESKIVMGSMNSQLTLGMSESHNDKLLAVIEQLKPIMESLGEYMNGNDMADDETIKATENAFYLVNS